MLIARFHGVGRPPIATAGTRHERQGGMSTREAVMCTRGVAIPPNLASNFYRGSR